MAIVLRTRLTEVLNGGISGLGAHCTLKATNLKTKPQLISAVEGQPTHGEASALQPERDQI